MEATQKERDKRYTYADFLTWHDDFRCELIDGKVYENGQPYIGDPGKESKLTPGYPLIHQSILGALAVQIGNFLKDKPEEVLHGPLAVRLNPDDGDDIVVLPDILVVCDASIFDDRSCIGAPDMVIEILSPTTSQYDKVIKFQKYQKAGVREYWIVDPNDKTVWVNILDNGRYYGTVYADTDSAPVHVLEGCTIELPDVFEMV